MDNSISAAGSSSGSTLDSLYSAQIDRMSVDVIKSDGEAALKLIEAAGAVQAPPQSDGKGMFVNTYA